MIEYCPTQVYGCKIIAKAAGCKILFCRLMVLFPFSVQSSGVERKQVAGRLYAGVVEMVFQEAAFRIAKGRKSHAKRPSFSLQKTAFCKALDIKALRRRRFHALQGMAERGAAGCDVYNK